MKRLALIILTLFLLFTNISCDAAQILTKKAVKVAASDGFNINSVLMYPKIDGKKEFNTVVLLHSLGYDSLWWGDLPNELLAKNYAVLMIDFRGHGQSIYDSKLERVSWKNMKNTAFAKYPDDVIAVINKVKEENKKRIFFNNWAIVGSDIGASTAVLAAEKMQTRPKTMIMLSPIVKTRGLYIPVKLAHLDNVDILSIIGTDDTVSKQASDYLSKFAQSNFSEYKSESQRTGMLMLKNDTGLTRLIISWISQYLN